MSMKNIFRLVLLISVSIGIASCSGKKTIEGDNYYDQGEYPKALESYNKYLKVYPRNTKTLYNRARTYEKLSNIEMAKKDLNKVLELDPNHLLGRITLGDLEFKEANYERAFYEFDLAVASHKQTSLPYAYRAKANQKLGKVRKALADYGISIRLDAGNGMAYLYRGTLYISQKKKSSACKDFTKANKLGVKEASRALLKYCNQ